MKRLIDLILLPVLALSSLIMLIHEFRPMLWRSCVRPAVFKMRAVKTHCYVSKAKLVNKVSNSSKTLISAFDNEIKKIIRLIRLESEELAELIKHFINKNRKESTVFMPYSLFS